MKTKYVIISPVRDEEKYFEDTIKSVVSQTVRPSQWLIVDDGSTDGTGAIADRFAARFPWIRVIHRENRGYRKSGGGVMEAFYEGYKHLASSDWDFLVKLDGDLSFASDYFEKCFQRFESDSKLGIAGGEIRHDFSGRLKVEENPRFHVRGATKIYRKACWDDIGGLWPAPGWDTIDEVKANMHGWKTQTFTDIYLLHHRFTGTEDGLLRTRVKQGLVCYISAYHPVFVLVRCLYRIFQKPYVIGSCAILYGFLRGYLIHHPSRVDDRTYVSYIQCQQLRRLCGMQTIWR